MSRAELANFDISQNPLFVLVLHSCTGRPLVICRKLFSANRFPIGLSPRPPVSQSSLVEYFGSGSAIRYKGIQPQSLYFGAFGWSARLLKSLVTEQSPLSPSTLASLLFKKFYAVFTAHPKSREEVVLSARVLRYVTPCKTSESCQGNADDLETTKSFRAVLKSNRGLLSRNAY
ncbi:uncharacterized protein BT62DRAFT_1005081 [Guyanagaster necrorhizus]|uniref:Uncharacterized protein n=1 Tax=Guyanagaster necrorhizus TaxID=856835 RepID=A0A9P8AT09_9AGAR|nr:uncharacterized protein BT62DRAFT_1005081 [Guyanagaster necrorhizus MCA 3950]KAG7446720.1 hypothetical protein BT62DRAFT_1005081 [Guyanagaster necrorhizus MCA 3950]